MSDKTLTLAVRQSDMATACAALEYVAIVLRVAPEYAIVAERLNTAVKDAIQQGPKATRPDLGGKP